MIAIHQVMASMTMILPAQHQLCPRFSGQGKICRELILPRSVSASAARSGGFSINSVCSAVTAFVCILCFFLFFFLCTFFSDLQSAKLVFQILKTCKTCSGKGAIECPGCKVLLSYVLGAANLLFFIPFFEIQLV